MRRVTGRDKVTRPFMTILIWTKRSYCKFLLSLVRVLDGCRSRVFSVLSAVVLFLLALRVKSARPELVQFRARPELTTVAVHPCQKPYVGGLPLDCAFLMPNNKMRQWAVAFDQAFSESWAFLGAVCRRVSSFVLQSCLVILTSFTFGGRFLFLKHRISFPVWDLPNAFMVYYAATNTLTTARRGTSKCTVLKI